MILTKANVLSTFEGKANKSVADNNYARFSNFTHKTYLLYIHGNDTKEPNPWMKIKILHSS
jgi:hypothetical protein